MSKLLNLSDLLGMSPPPLSFEERFRPRCNYIRYLGSSIPTRVRAGDEVPYLGRAAGPMVPTSGGLKGRQEPK